MVQQKVIKPAMQSEIFGCAGLVDTCCAPLLCPQWDLLPLCGWRGAGAGRGGGGVKLPGTGSPALANTRVAAFCLRENF